jgi:RNA-directed DNA polymerase
MTRNWVKAWKYISNQVERMAKHIKSERGVQTPGVSSGDSPLFNSESWKKLPWKKFQVDLFRLQRRIYKAVREGDMAKAIKLQKLIIRSRGARFLAIRQVTQLNKGRKTAGIDGLTVLNFKQRFELEEIIASNATKWKHQRLREIKIPKKNGKTRILKVPTIADRAWQCLIKQALEPAHEATFHEGSYGFRTGRSAHDAQKQVFNRLNSNANGAEKRIIELDIKSCFDRVSHDAIIKELIAPREITTGIQKALKAGVNPEFPEQGTPQGGVFSPLLANIALNGIERVTENGYSESMINKGKNPKVIRYADDLIIIAKPEHNTQNILEEIKKFLNDRGMELNAEKTKIVATTEGFDFLGWHMIVQKNGKFRCYPSKENYESFREKVKEIVNNSNCGSKEKVHKLAPMVRGWRNYHQYCCMEGEKFKLSAMRDRTHKVFSKEKKNNFEAVSLLIKKAFPAVPYSENRFVNVAGDKSPYDGDIAYWSKRNSKLYDGTLARQIRRQNHKCVYCGLEFFGDDIELHHIDGNHQNWKRSNLSAIHKTCHHYVHMGKREQSPNQVGS